MESSLAIAAGIGDQRQKIEQYRHILATLLSSSPPDISQAKRFIDHSTLFFLSPSLVPLFAFYFLFFIYFFSYNMLVVSDEVPLVVSRQLLQTFAQELGKLDPEAEKEIAQYALTQIQPRVVSFEEQVCFLLVLFLWCLSTCFDTWFCNWGRIAGFQFFHCLIWNLG